MTFKDKEALFRKYLAGNCSQDELAILLDHFANNENEDALRGMITEALKRTPQNRELQERAAHLASTVRTNLIEQLNQQTTKKRTIRQLVGRYAAVAAAVAILLTVGTMLHFRQTHIAEEPVPTSEFGGDVPAGGDRAMLTLPDGHTVTLNSAKKGIRMDGSLRYTDGSEVAAPALIGDAEWLALATPRGGQYHIELPDGSRVWLNAASKLRYPTRFSEHDRVVELEGEAYFEVTKQDRPFLVKTDAQTVRVLGTQFNISAYSDDGTTLTTLVDGSVTVSLTGQQTEMSLVPGEQSVVKAKSITKTEVDVAPFINWKSGGFSFRETEIHQVMRQLSRWYNVDVIIDENIPKTYFYGDIKRDKSLAQVLNILKKGGVNFKIIQKPERPQLVVMP